VQASAEGVAASSSGLHHVPSTLRGGSSMQSVNLKPSQLRRKIELSIVFFKFTCPDRQSRMKAGDAAKMNIEGDKIL